MSFSFTVTEEDVTSTLSSAIDDKIVELPEGPGKQEATALADVIPEAIRVLIGEYSEFASASVSGSASANNAQFSVYVNFKTVSSATPATNA